MLEPKQYSERQSGKRFDTNSRKGLSFYMMHVVNLWDSLPQEVMEANIMHEITKDLFKIVEEFIGTT